MEITEHLKLYYPNGHLYYNDIQYVELVKTFLEVTQTTTYFSDKAHEHATKYPEQKDIREYWIGIVKMLENKRDELYIAIQNFPNIKK
jgi:hypothetical protein